MSKNCWRLQVKTPKEYFQRANDPFKNSTACGTYGLNDFTVVWGNIQNFNDANEKEIVLYL